MNDKIDVLAVMDATIKLAQDGYIPEHHEVVAMESARAAIAELIEAADRVWTKGGAVPGGDWDALGNAIYAVWGA